MPRSLLVMLMVSSLSGCTGSISSSLAARVLDAGAPSGDGSPDAGNSGSSDAGTSPDGGGATASVCASPVSLYDVSNPTTVVGTGTAASCTESAFSAAVALGGKIVFNCGGAATIPITAE